MIGKPLYVLIVAGVCVLGLIGLVVRETQARANGTEVLFAMQPVDPRALLAGHYVMIDLQERLPDGAACPVNDGGDWVGLSAIDGVHHVVGAGAARETTPGDIAVRGSFECFEVFVSDDAPTQNAMRLRLGVDRFYVNQTDAERIERVMFDQRADGEARAFAILSIGTDGRASVKGVQVDGQRYESSWR
jgi:hypothetical protein